MTRFIFGGSPADIVYAALTADRLLRVAPGATVTVWDAPVGGNQITDMQLSFNGNAVSTLTTDSIGRLPRFYGPDSVAELWIDSGSNDRWILTSTQLGSLLNDKLDKTAAPAAHTHTTVDIVGLQRVIDQVPRIVEFDPVTNTWPYQADITLTYPPVAVVWTGNAGVPSQAREGDYIDQQVTGGSVIIPTPTPTPTPDPDPITNISTTVPTVTANGALVSMTASITTTGPQEFAYIVMAVRNPAGANTDPANGVLANVSVNSTTRALTASFTAAQSGTTWTAWVAYVRAGDDPNNQANWVDGPKRTFTVTLPNTGNPTPGPGHDITTPTGRIVPYMGRSGLGWNSGCFTADQWEQSATNAFGTYRGRLIDCRLVFAVHDGGTWDQMINVPSEWQGWAGITVISIGLQPQPGQNAATAAGTNNHYFEDFGRNLVARGMNNNRTIVRIAWEGNITGGYSWTWDRGGADQYIAAYRNASASIRRTAPNILCDFNVNKDYPSNGGKTWQQVADALMATHSIDILSGDFYDMYNGWRNDTNRMNEWVNKPGGQRLTVLAYSRANNIPLGFPEWALCALAGGDGTGGGDDLLFMQKTKEFFTLLASEGRLAYECYYNEQGAPDTLKHELFRYPNSETYYRSTGGWGNH